MLLICTRSLIVGIALFCSAVPLCVFGQSPTQDVDRARLLQNQTRLQQDPYGEENGVADDGRATASPNDPDLGEQEILKRSQYYQPFTASVTTPFYYTSNVALSRRNEQGDFLVAPAASFTYAPRITKTFFGEITIGQQMFYYDRFSELDFGSFDVRIGAAYYLPQLHNLTLHAQYVFNRLTTDNFDEFFTNHSLFFNAELPFRIGRAQQVTFGADADFSIYANEDAPQRHEFDLYVGYAVNLTRSLSVDAVGRIYLRDYVNVDRTDVSELLAVSATYRFTKWFSAGVVSTFGSSQSNQSIFDYNIANIGGSVTFAVKF